MNIVRIKIISDVYKWNSNQNTNINGSIVDAVMVNDSMDAVHVYKTDDGYLSTVAIQETAFKLIENNCQEEVPETALPNTGTVMNFFSMIKTIEFK